MQKHSSYRVWFVGVLGVVGLLCVASVRGQVIPEEGFPTKPVFPEESSAVPGLHEECVPFLTSGDFGEECAEEGGDMGDNMGGNNGPGAIGNGFDATGSSAAPLDPAWRTPPRLECPSAVFLEELETGAIDCHAWDTAGAEHLEYHWEPIGAATRNYLENPRLIPEDVSNPVVVAPSFPQYETLESFLSEEGTQRYRYRLTATSRATGLSSWSEVEVFVLSSRPGVYCPLELEVEEGGTVALACEGADPLSFRMDDDAGASPALWEWTGLWGASTAPLMAANTPAPLFTAPEGSAGNTYHYVASMTTSSSGVLQTARRRVSVTVVGREATGNPPPVITCKDIAMDVQNHIFLFTIECEVEDPADVPSGAKYSWAALSPADGMDRLSSAGGLTPTFMIDFGALPQVYEYRVTLSAPGIADVTQDVTVNLWKSGDFMTCQTYYEVYAGALDFQLNCKSNDPDRGEPVWDWTLVPSAFVKPRMDMRLYDPAGAKDWLARSVSAPAFDPTFDVPDSLPAAMEIDYYEYFLCLFYKEGDKNVYADSDEITVKVLPAPEITVDCEDLDPIYEGRPDVTLNCTASGAPNGSGYTYLWEARDSTPNTDLLSATDVANPTFLTPDALPKSTEYKYRLTVTWGHSVSASTDVTVEVRKKPDIVVGCSGQPYSAYEGGEDFNFDCFASRDPSGVLHAYAWSPRGSTKDLTRLRGRTTPTPRFDVPDAVDEDETYEYRLTVTPKTEEGGWKNVTVTVLNKIDIAVTCAGNPYSAYEGAEDIALDCTAPPAPEGSTYSYVWTARGSTPDTDLLSATDIASPSFIVPDGVSQEATYEYLLTVSSDHAETATAEVTVKVLDKPDILVDCLKPDPVYEGTKDIALDCAASGAPWDVPAYTYAWTARGSTPDTDLLSATDIRDPVFDVLDAVSQTTKYEYRVTATAANAETGTAEVTVTVLNKPDIAVTCAGNPYSEYEGSEDFVLDCRASGAPAGSDYAYAWTTRGGTKDTGLLSPDIASAWADQSAAKDMDRLSATNVSSPVFLMPATVDMDKTYEYLLTVSAKNAETGTAEVTVKVLDKVAPALSCAVPNPAYEGSEDIALACTAGAVPGGSDYAYAWTARGATPDTELLSRADIASPLFLTPDEVDADATYEYLLTVSAKYAETVTAEVTVIVLNKPDILAICGKPDPVYEGSVEHILLACAAAGAPEGSTYAYAWTARNATLGTGLLGAVDIPSPTFAVPKSVPKSTTYEYLLTVSAENAETAMAEVTVTVLNTGAIALVCPDPEPAYEGADNISLSCEASGAPGEDPVYSYVWEARGDTEGTGLLSATDISSPSFDVPNNVDEYETFAYMVTATAANAEAGMAYVTVMVLERPAVVVVCTDPDAVYEGSVENILLRCTASGALSGSSYSYSWEARGSEADTGFLSASDISSPIFYVPASVDADKTYKYGVRVTAGRAEAGVTEVTVTVLNKPTLVLACTDPRPVYEGSPALTLDCSASGAPGGPSGSSYSYVWEARSNTGATPDTDLLSRTDIASPAFAVPTDVPQTTTYEYFVTVSAENAEDGTAEVTVTVLDSGVLNLSCATPDPVYEGSPAFTLDCAASSGPGGPEDSAYEYAWAAHGATQDTDLLSAVDVASPVFAVPTEVLQTTRYEYLVTVLAANAEAATAEVTVTVLDKPALALVCTNPDPVYEGVADIALNCTASGGPVGFDGSAYEYAWAAHGATLDTGLLSATDVASPTFAVPTEVAADETYEYLVTVSAEHAEDAMAEVIVTVLDKPALALACATPDPAYEGSPDLTLDCSASGAPGAPSSSSYSFVWAPHGSTPDTDLLSAVDIASPTFAVPTEVAADETYEYLVTVSAEHAEDAMAEVTVTVLNKPALALACATPDPVYEGSPDFTLDCAASGAPGAPGAPDGSAYEYAWAAHGATLDTDLLSAVDVASPTFAVPDAVDADETYEYLLTASAENAEDAMAEVTVTVLDKIETPAPGPAPVTPDPDPDPDPTPPAPEPAPPVAGGPDPVSPSPDPGAFVIDPSGLGVRTSVSSLRFGVQSSDTQVSLDALTDRISTSVSGPYHAGRMTLASDGDLAFDERGEVALSIEMATPVVLRRRGDEKAPLLVLSPSWSMAESCEQLSSRSIGGLHTETQLSESDCRMLLFGGELDLSGAPTGRYAGNLNVILRTALGEETHSVPVEVTVAPAQRVITIGPGGVRFDTSREVPAGLTAEQNVSIYPDVAYLTRDEPSGAFELSNPSLIPLEVSVSARFGYAEATAAGFETVVEDPDHARLGDLSEALEIHPGTLILMPGEQGVVRYGVREEALATMTEAGYAAFFEVVSSPRRYVRTDQLPEASSIGKTARVTMRVPGAYAPEAGASSLRAELLSVSQGAALSATFLVETDGAPFLGEVAAYDGDGRELGRRRTLVYTRSRVRMSLDRLPEGEAVFLRFAPSGSGRVSEPVSVPWNAPRRATRGGREIGAAPPGKQPPGAVFAETSP